MWCFLFGRFRYRSLNAIFVSSAWPENLFWALLCMILNQDKSTFCYMIQTRNFNTLSCNDNYHWVGGIYIDSICIQNDAKNYMYTYKAYTHMLFISFQWLSIIYSTGIFYPFELHSICSVKIVKVCMVWKQPKNVYQLTFF